MTITKREAKRLKLRQYMDEHGLKSHEIADMCLYKRQTVRAWMCNQREVPQRALKRLNLE
jgi:hypothetical protein